MFDVASASSLFTGAISDVGTLVSLVVAAVLGIAVGLIGLGYGYRKIKAHVTGRKF